MAIFDCEWHSLTENVSMAGEKSVQKIKLCFVLIEIIIGKNIWLTLSRNEIAIFAVIDTSVFESLMSKKACSPALCYYEGTIIV